MNKRKLTPVRTDAAEIKSIVKDVVGASFKEQEDLRVKQEHINKALKKDTKILKEKSKKHVHSCPSCEANFKTLGESFEYCEGCGTIDMTIKKGQKLLICDKCGGVVSNSIAKCPNCGSTRAHYAK